MIYNRNGRAVSFGEFDAARLGRVAPQFGEFDAARLGRVAPQFGDLEGIWSRLKSGANAVGGAVKTVGKTVSKGATTVVRTSEAAGKLPFQAVNKVAQSGVRLVSGIAKETGKLGGTILAAPARVSIEATKGVLGGAKATIGKIFGSKSGSSPAADTAKAAADEAARQGLAPPPGAAPPPGGGDIQSTSSGLSTTPAAGSGATFDVSAAQKALDEGASPADAVKAGADAANPGMSTVTKIALAGGAAVALFIGYKMLARRRGGGRTKS